MTYSYSEIKDKLKECWESLNTFLETEYLVNAKLHIEEAINSIKEEEDKEYNVYKESDESKRDLDDLKKRAKELFGEEEFKI